VSLPGKRDQVPILNLKLRVRVGGKSSHEAPFLTLRKAGLRSRGARTSPGAYVHDLSAAPAAGDTLYDDKAKALLYRYVSRGGSVTEGVSLVKRVLGLV
jgi:hypothetical protein